MDLKTFLPFAVMLLQASVTSVVGQCNLATYKLSSFMNSARVHTDFKSSMDKINGYAASCGVKVYVTSSFRKSGQEVGGAIVTPAKRGNHFVGHAIDMNLSGPGYWCNSRCLRYDLERRSEAKCFIDKIRADPSLRWGGDFSVKDPVHIDDGINLRNRNTYDRLYNLFQRYC